MDDHNEYLENTAESLPTSLSKILIVCRARLTDNEVCSLRLDWAGRMLNLVSVVFQKPYSKINHCSNDQLLLL